MSTVREYTIDWLLVWAKTSLPHSCRITSLSYWWPKGRFWKLIFKTPGGAKRNVDIQGPTAKSRLW